MTTKQRERQKRQHRERGRYAKVNPCYRCGKSAGVDYLSSAHTDTADELGNEWHDIALCLCEPCAVHLAQLTPTAAWADVTHADYGRLPQGKSLDSKGGE